MSTHVPVDAAKLRLAEGETLFSAHIVRDLVAIAEAAEAEIVQLRQERDSAETSAQHLAREQVRLRRQLADLQHTLETELADLQHTLETVARTLA
jgi:hypothetical protein